MSGEWLYWCCRCWSQRRIPNTSNEDRGQQWIKRGAGVLRKSFVGSILSVRNYIFLTFSQFYNLIASLIIIIIWSASWKAFRIWNSTLCDEVSLLAVSILSLTAVCLMKLDTESFEQSFEQQPGFSVPLKFSICNTNPRKDRPQPVLAFAEYQ